MANESLSNEQKLQQLGARLRRAVETARPLTNREETRVKRALQARLMEQRRSHERGNDRGHERER